MRRLIATLTLAVSGTFAGLNIAQAAAVPHPVSSVTHYGLPASGCSLRWAAIDPAASWRLWRSGGTCARNIPNFRSDVQCKFTGVRGLRLRFGPARWGMGSQTSNYSGGVCTITINGTRHLGTPYRGYVEYWNTNGDSFYQVWGPSAPAP